MVMFFKTESDLSLFMSIDSVTHFMSMNVFIVVSGPVLHGGYVEQYLHNV